MKTLYIAVVLVVAVALGMRMGCAGRDGGKKSSEMTSEPKTEVKKKPTLEQKIAVYKRVDLEKLLAEYFVAQEQERKITAAEQIRESFQKRHARAVVADDNDYRAQFQAEQRSNQEAEESIALLKKALPRSSREVADATINYLPEKKVWYLASLGGKEYAVGAGSHTTYYWFKTTYYWFKLPDTYELSCNERIQDTLRIVAAEQTNAPPAETNGPPCREEEKNVRSQ